MRKPERQDEKKQIIAGIPGRKSDDHDQTEKNRTADRKFKRQIQSARLPRWPNAPAAE